MAMWCKIQTKMEKWSWNLKKKIHNKLTLHTLEAKWNLKNNLKMLSRVRIRKRLSRLILIMLKEISQKWLMDSKDLTTSSTRNTKSNMSNTIEMLQKKVRHNTVHCKNLLLNKDLKLIRCTSKENILKEIKREGNWKWRDNN